MLRHNILTSIDGVLKEIWPGYRMEHVKVICEKYDKYSHY